MLEIKNIRKAYKVGDQEVEALKGLDVTFRQKEFVSILGPSGCGKTTLLNIIGGLDKYTSGDLVIDSVSTKEYLDKDWDSYRNHRIGFVFQSYNLINHLTILDNVELALTLSGVSKEERLKKAEAVLVKVGLEDHLKKKPNQLSGGQMQRVAIARALVNEPNIILADEPTGALDTKTSVEIMELLKEISADKLIIMVTHNPELAKTYSTRIIKLLDGKITDDSNPYKISTQAIVEKTEKTSMGFITAMSLSLKNLITKKFRTGIIAFAGSIGIIGVALVLALQFGFGNFINKMETDTFASAPIQINATAMNMDALMGGGGSTEKPIDGKITSTPPSVTSIVTMNNITSDYVNFLDGSDLSSHAQVVYTYGYLGNYAYRDSSMPAGVVNETPFNISPLNMAMSAAGGQDPTLTTLITQSMYSMSAYEQFAQIVGPTGRLYKNGPTDFEAMLLVDDSHSVPIEILQFLGFTPDADGIIRVNYADIVNKQFKVYSNDAYFKNNGGVYEPKTNAELAADYDSGTGIISVTITGIITSNSDYATLGTGIVYNDTVRDELMLLNSASNVAGALLGTTTPASVFSAPSPVAGSPVPFDRYGNTSQAWTRYVGAYAPEDSVSSILIYPNSFDSKDEVLSILDQWNDDHALNQGNIITYTDMISSIMGMLRTMINSISIVLVAFSAVSLVVSSVMISIIMYTSVLERTKEIGVLRSIGARKKDISRVFNAEAILIGLLAGTLGVLITYLLCPIINLILDPLLGSSGVATLFWVHAIVLIIISMCLTFIAGLIPARIAAKKDPVTALRSE